jgi:tripartite-type tricarboxylate transporter receptor subunit TctC
VENVVSPLFAFVTAVALATAPCIAQAQHASSFDKSSGGSGQGFPNKPIRLVAATTAASQPDTLARMIGHKLSESWGRPVVIDNRPGAGGILAASTVAKAAPDGHTLLYALPNFAISAVLQPSLPYDPLKDFAAATQIGMSTNVLVVSAGLGIKSVKDLIALAKAQPGKLIFASSATGSASHLSGARFNLIAGIKVVQVAFKGGPDSTIEVLAGRAHYHVGTMGVVLPFVNEGKLLALAVTSPKRTPVLPDVPALGEMLSEFRRPETSHALLAPAGTPRLVLNQISKEVARVLDLPDVKERLQGIGFVAAPSTPEECDKILRAQIETLSKLVSDAGLRPK